MSFFCLSVFVPLLRLLGSTSGLRLSLFDLLLTLLHTHLFSHHSIHPPRAVFVMLSFSTPEETTENMTWPEKHRKYIKSEYVWLYVYFYLSSFSLPFFCYYIYICVFVCVCVCV